MHSTLRITTWNSRVMSAAILYLRTLLKQCDIITINEHWLHVNKLNKLTEISDEFHVFARSSNYSGADSFGISRGQGGIAIMWRKSIGGISPVTNIIHDRFCAIRIETYSHCVFYLFSIYLPDVSSKDDYKTCIDELSGAIDSLEEGSLVMLCGDFNGDVGDSLGDRGWKKPTKQGMHVKHFVDKYNLIPANMLKKTKGPIETYVGPVSGSTIDYIMIPLHLTDNIKSCRVIQDECNNTSDHRPVTLVLDVGKLMPRTFEIETKSRLNWSKLKQEDISRLYTGPVSRNIRELLVEVEHQNLRDGDIDKLFAEITAILLDADKNFPKKRFRKNIKPFWNSELTDLKKKKVFFYNEWKNLGRPRDPQNEAYCKYMQTKVDFMKRLRQLSKEYDDKEIAEVIKSTEVDYKFFWKALRKSRTSSMASVFSVKNKDGIVKHDIDGVLEVCFNHFNELSTPKHDPKYDDEHFKYVNNWVDNTAKLDDTDQFLEHAFSHAEMAKAMTKLHKGKSLGYDDVTSEHLLYAGEHLISILCILYNACVANEYIPICFRKGLQVPLYKGKNACSLDPNSYRGITLLSSFNKPFEILLWTRIEPWWDSNQIISQCQGACRKKHSCVHSAFVLQEAVAASREANDKCFVAYFDVAKAFDSIWINGLFKQLYDLGITGKLWRVLRKGYIGFESRVRIHTKTSDWYAMDCGIHQCGFLSSLKYIAFINSLLVQLVNSGLCNSITGIKCSPIGYADDMSAACISRDRIDRVTNMVNQHGNRWRYEYNARKSAILIYGEDKRTHDHNALLRNFNLGGKKVPEKEHYDHVGVKACIYEDNSFLVEDKISKGKKTLNASTSLGIRRGGLSMAVCNLIFWLVIVPITTYGSEIWTMTPLDYENLESFQRYAGRRFQRFSGSSPNFSSYYGLGWIGICTHIFIKKLMFAFSIITMSEQNWIKQLFKQRAIDFNENIRVGMLNRLRSPTYEILKVAINFGVYDLIMKQLFSQVIYTKRDWKSIVWRVAWKLEDKYWHTMYPMQKKCFFLVKTINTPHYLTWWYIADLYPTMMSICEDMAKLVCNASMLKSDDVMLSKGTHGARMCIECDLGVVEDVKHIVMQCPIHEDSRKFMFQQINGLPNDIGPLVLSEPGEILYILLGKSDQRLDIDQMIQVWLISASFISRMYRIAIKKRRHLDLIVK